jgi:mono/diheme cytochrome c family protein
VIASSLSFFRIAPILLSLALAEAGCDNMKHQPNSRPYDPSVYFSNGASARLPPAHTVPSGPRPSEAFLTGKSHDQWLASVPVPATRRVLERGRERFNINCAVCHGEDGYGRGIVVRRGFPAPPSFHSEALRTLPAGQIYDVITRGYGAMYPAADRVAPADRWAIVLYIRALQLSQHATLADVASTAQAQLLHP